MDGIIETLLRLEGAKHKALIDGDAPAYDEHVRSQLHLLDSTPDFRAAARQSPHSIAALSKLIQHNTALFLNLLSTSPAFVFSQNGYTSNGTVETPVKNRIAVEG